MSKLIPLLVLFFAIPVISGCTKDNEDPTEKLGLIINELMPSNSKTVTDPDGDFDDWIEITNISDLEQDLSGYFLTDSQNELTKWKFPEGTILKPDSFLIVWADGDSLQSGIHSNFKLSSTGEKVLLVTQDLSIIDEAEYTEQPVVEGEIKKELSYARIPNGSGDFSWQTPTFMEINIVKPYPGDEAGIIINEIMPANSTTASDQNGEYDDWIEIYNVSDKELDISGFYLTDSKNIVAKWKFPQGTRILANSYLITWADADTLQSGIHTNFKLSALGETILLLTPELVILDKVTYTGQVVEAGQPVPEFSYSRLPSGTGPFSWQTPTFNAMNIQNP